MRNKFCLFNGVFLFVSTVLGILVGAMEASLWWLGYIPTVRAMLPYAVANAMLIFALTPILTVMLRNCSCNTNTEIGTPSRNGGFVSIIMSAAAIFLIFTQVFVGTVLPFTLKIILAFFGSISFWVMLIVFIFWIYSIASR